MYHYLLGPYALHSEFEFPELANLETESDITLNDVVLRSGSVRENLPKATEVSKWCFSNGTQTLIKCHDTARFLVDQKLQVSVEIEPAAKNTGDWRAYFLGPVLNILCFRSHYLAVHCCALVLNGRAILIGGESGHGKSTTAAALRKKGLKVLSDDLSIIAPDPSGNLVVYPAYPTARLWPDTLDHFEEDSSDLSLVNSDFTKYLLSTRAEFHRQPVPVSRVYHLQKSDNETLVEFRKEFGLKAITTMVALTHRAFLLPGLGYEKTNFEQCSRFIKTIEVYSLTRRWGLEYLNEVTEAIIEHESQ